MQGLRRLNLFSLLVQLSLFFKVIFAVAIHEPAKSECDIMKRELIEPYDSYTTSNGTQWLFFETSNGALDYVENLYVAGQDISALRLFANDTKMALEQFTVNNETLRKRWSCSSAPLGTHFTQRQTAQSGIWYTPWAKNSCGYNQLSSAQALDTLSWSTSTSVSYSAGFDFDFAEAFSANVGVTITKTDTRGGTWGCYCNPGDKVSVWTQAPMWWSDQQTQSCDRHYYGENGCKCGAWSAYIHGDCPAKNKDVNFGCSSGAASECN